jgi:hypothetical protein
MLVRKAKKKSAGTPAPKERRRLYFGLFWGSFTGYPRCTENHPIKREKKLKPAGTARRHMKFPVPVLLSPMQKIKAILIFKGR